MIDFTNPEFQKLLAILSLLLIIPIGGYIQHRMLKKRKEIEDSYSYPSQNSSSDESSEELSPNEQQIKQYILDYKESYPKESIKEALIQAGNSSEEVEKLVEKYY